jgi:hypothetical protein
MYKEMQAKTENVTSENVYENTNYARKAVYTVSWRKGFSINVHTYNFVAAQKLHTILFNILCLETLQRCLLNVVFTSVMCYSAYYLGKNLPS